jgi:membrane protein DedA with SNARE-associated domain/rhodanese-related sulfurtransferase
MTSSPELNYVWILLAVLAEQLCLPVPSGLLLMTAGALSAHGQMQTSFIILLSILACLTADGIWFWFGRRWGSQVMRLVCRLTADPRKTAREAHEKFSRYGVALICAARFLPGLGAVMAPLAAAEGVSVAGFMALDTVSSFLWSAFYAGIGYIFSDELNVAFRWAQRFGTAIGIAIGVPVGIYACWQGLVLLRMIRRLRLRRISPAMLSRKLKSKSKVAVLDLLDFEDETGAESQAAIPGAFRVDPARLRTSPHITIPNDVEIVLYCSSGRDIVSARAAMALQRIGVEKVWVLDGGLKAWRKQGFPVSQSPEVPEVAAERVGVKLPPNELLETGA